MIDNSEVVPVHIKISEFDVISSGTIIASANNEVKFEIGSVASPLSIILAFDDSEEEGDFKKSRFSGEALGPSSIKIVLHNFTNIIGIYPSNPIKIGVFQKRELYLDLIVHHHAGTAIRDGSKIMTRKVINYTISLGGPSPGA
jgi:hypothetical protein